MVTSLFFVLIKDHEPANFAQNEAKHQADDLSSNKKDDQELESPSLVILYTTSMGYCTQPTFITSS